MSKGQREGRDGLEQHHLSIRILLWEALRHTSSLVNFISMSWIKCKSFNNNTAKQAKNLRSSRRLWQTSSAPCHKLSSPCEYYWWHGEHCFIPRMPTEGYLPILDPRTCPAMANQTLGNSNHKHVLKMKAQVRGGLVSLVHEATEQPAGVWPWSGGDILMDDYVSAQVWYPFSSVCLWVLSKT